MESNVNINTPNMLSVNFDASVAFLGNNSYETVDFENGTGDDLTIEVGRVLARVAATNKIVLFDAGGAGGAQYPIGVNTSKTIIIDGETGSLSMCVSGNVATEKIVLGAGDTLDTVVEDKTVRDRIASDTLGIKLLAGTELTKDDN